MGKGENARDAIEQNDKPSAKTDLPAAGPHAKDSLTDKSKTPGAGSLPDEDEDSTTPGAG